MYCVYSIRSVRGTDWIRYKASENCTQVVVTSAYIMTRQDLLLITTAASLALTVFDATSHVYFFFSVICQHLAFVPWQFGQSADRVLI